MITNVMDYDFETYQKEYKVIYGNVLASSYDGTLRCPICAGNVKIHGFYRRRLLTPERVIVKIIQVRCASCRSIHAVIPNFIIPYKHYQAKLIDNALHKEELQICQADNSTIRRWRSKRCE